MGTENRQSLVSDLNFHLYNEGALERGPSSEGPSHHVPLNPIFKSKTPFVFRSDHGRLLSPWAPGLVCSCKCSGEPSADTKRTVGKPASIPPSIFTPQLGPGERGGGRPVLTTAFSWIVSVLVVIKAPSP